MSDDRNLLEKVNIVTIPSQQCMSDNSGVRMILEYMELNEWLNLNSFSYDLFQEIWIVRSHFYVGPSLLVVSLTFPMIDVSRFLDSNFAAVVLVKILAYSIQSEYRNPNSMLLEMILWLIMENATILQCPLPMGLVPDTEYCEFSMVSY